MLTLMLITGAVIVGVTIFLLVKGYEARVTLIGAGILMACIGGAPMDALAAFAKSMTNQGLIQAVCSCMGFAMAVRVTECDKHLINAMASVISKVRPLLIPGVVLGTFLVNVALPSAAGTAEPFLFRSSWRRGSIRRWPPPLSNAALTAVCSIRDWRTTLS